MFLCSLLLSSNLLPLFSEFNNENSTPYSLPFFCISPHKLCDKPTHPISPSQRLNQIFGIFGRSMSKYDTLFLFFLRKDERCSSLLVLWGEISHKLKRNENSRFFLCK